MSVIFFGNSQYSLIGAQILQQKIGLTAIVTINNSPPEAFAKKERIPSFAVQKFDQETQAKIKALHPDFFVVEDYGLILPNELLALPSVAALNIHHSLLPKFRGPAPAPATILSGDTVSGVTIITMAERVDAGDIVAQETYQLKPDETTDSLLRVLNQLGATKMVDVLQHFSEYKPIPQDESKAIFTSYMKKTDGFIELDNPPAPEKLDRMIRAYYPWPGVWTRVQGRDNRPKIVKFYPGKRIQMEGKKPMSVKDFLNGYPELKGTIEKLFVEES
jgi:methionyl-tRNA formyltransferase